MPQDSDSLDFPDTRVFYAGSFLFAFALAFIVHTLLNGGR